MDLNDTLKNIKKNDILTLSIIQAEIDDMEKKQILNNHENKIWQGKNGKWYTCFYGGGEKKLIKRNSREDLEKAIVERYKELDENPTFKDLFYQWLQNKLDYGEIQKQTYDNYIFQYESLIEGTDLANMKINKLTEQYLEEFIKTTIKNKKLSNKRWSNLRIVLSGTIKYAKKNGLTNITMRYFLDELDLSKKSFTNHYKSDEEQVYTKEEIEKVKNYIWSKDPTIIEYGILLTIETGLRRGELSALKPCDIFENYIHVCRTEIRTKNEDGSFNYDVRESTKGRDGERNVILTDNAKRILKRIKMLNPFGEYLFMKDGVRIKGHSFTKRIKNICKKIDIPVRAMHKIRKTYATNLLNAGVDEKLIEKQMGHTDISTTKQFYYYNNRKPEESQEIIQNALG